MIIFQINQLQQGGKLGWLKFQTVKFENGRLFEIENSRTFKCRIAELTRIGNENWENWFISNGKYENWENCEQCGILNGRTIRKLPILRAKFWFFQMEKILGVC